jgi:hypothetical protein
VLQPPGWPTELETEYMKSSFKLNEWYRPLKLNEWYRSFELNEWYRFAVLNHIV